MRLFSLLIYFITRLIKRFVLFLILLTLLFLGAGYFFFATTSGLQYALKLAASLAPGKLEVEQASGALGASFSLTNVTYQYQGTHIFIKSLDLAWLPKELLNKKIILESLKINKVSINLPATLKTLKNQTPASAVNLNKALGFLNAIKLNNLVINDLTVNRQQELIARLTIAGKVGQTWNLKWNISIPHLKSILNEASGSIISDGHLSGTRFDPFINAHLKIKQFHLPTVEIGNVSGSVFSKVNSERIHFQLRGDRLNILQHFFPSFTFQGNTNLKNKHLISQFSFALSKANKAFGTITFPNFKSFTDTKQQVDGKIHFDLAELKTLIPKIPEVNQIRGKLKGVLNIQGQIVNPTFLLNANIEAASLHVPRLGMTLQAIKLTTQYRKGRPFLFSGDFISGKGFGKIDGQINLEQPGLPCTLHLQGNNLQLTHLMEYKINVTPDLHMNYANGKIELTGEVHVPYAGIWPKDFSQVVTLPSEVSYLNEKKTAEISSPLNLAMKLKIVLGKEIQLTYQNLQTNLAGQIFIYKEPGRDPIATGELFTIHGKYFAYNKEFTIKKGRVIYTGNQLTNPGLDIRTEQKIQTVTTSNGSPQFDNKVSSMVYTGKSTLTVGLLVSGTVNKPVISFYSNPSGLSQEDILSYLIFGYPRSQIKSAASLTFLNTLLINSNQKSLNVGDMTNKVKNTLGLSELSIGSTEYFDPEKNQSKNTSTVNVGKKIGNKLFMNYRVGLFDSLQVFSVIYKINKRWSIKSETNNIDTGADLIYEIEKD